MDIIKNKYRRQTILSEKEKNKLIEGIISCADCGYPFALVDLRLSTQSYLHRIREKFHD